MYIPPARQVKVDLFLSFLCVKTYPCTVAVVQRHPCAFLIGQLCLSLRERVAIRHFETTHTEEYAQHYSYLLSLAVRKTNNIDRH